MRKTVASIAAFFTPRITGQGKPYRRDDILADLFAGITVAIIQVPQSMAFALIAGLPAIYGLYASLPGFIASLWGSSRQLSTGPVALVSVLTFTSLVPFAEPRTAEYIGLAASLAVLVGIIYLALGLCRFGYILHLVPHSVISGFSSAAALIIILTQLPVLLGLPNAQHSLAIQNLLALLIQLPQLSLLALGIGASAMVLIFLSRRLPQIFPSALVVLIIGIVLGYVITRLGTGVALVGEIPPGLPTFILPPLNTATLFLLFPKAIVLAIVAFVGTHATAKNAAMRTRERLDTDRELVGQGLANVVTGFFSGFPIAGSFTRTAINVEAGARTGIAALIGAGVTLLTLIFLTPMFAFLPRTVLAAIVITAAIPIVNFKRIRDMAEISRTDGLIAALTLMLALVLALDDAVFLGILAALLVFIWQTTSGARVSEMGVNPEWNVLRGAHIDPRVELIPQTIIAHIGMSMYYANTDHLLTQTERLMQDREEKTGEKVRTIVLDMSGVHFIDISALEMFSDFLERMRENNVRVGMIYLRYSVRTRLEKMQRPTEIIIFHNITELKNACAPSEHHMLTLNASRPEFLKASQ